MSTEENKAIVRRWFEEAWQREDAVEAADEFFHPFYVAHNTRGGSTSGVAPVKKAVAQARAAFPDIRFSVVDQVAEGDKVVTRLVATGTHQGEMMGTAPTGKQVVRHGLVLFRLADGKIAESWRHWDEHYLEELGIVTVQRPTTKAA